MSKYNAKKTNIKSETMIKNTRLLFFVLILSVATGLIFGSIKKPAILEKSETSNRKILLGAWVGGFWDPEKKEVNLEVLTDYESKIGKKLAIAHVFLGWDELSGNNFLNTLNSINTNGWTPMVSANPYFTNKCKTSPFNIYKAIALGSCDDWLRTISQSFKSYGKPVFFRFAWEMNIKDMNWGIQKVDSSPHEFKDAWIRFHNTLKENEVNNVYWVFSVNTNKEGSVPYAEIYPGDAYVDWLAIDGYNWGRSQNWSNWQSFDQVFGKSYEDLASVSPTKPIMISEFNSDYKSGNKEAWMRDMLGKQLLSDKYARVEAIVFFDEDKTREENIDWRMDATPEIFKTLKKVLNSPVYTSSL